MSVASFLLPMEQVHGQTNEEKAYAKGMEAIDLMESGEIQRSIKLLEEAKKLDPKNIHYPYEIAYAHYLDKNYDTSIKILEKLSKHDGASDRIYQLLGNSYSMSGNRDKAISTYERGLQTFPRSGSLHLERGNMEMFVEEYERALHYYEKASRWTQDSHPIIIGPPGYTATPQKRCGA